MQRGAIVHGLVSSRDPLAHGGVDGFRYASAVIPRRDNARQVRAAPDSTRHVKKIFATLPSSLSAPGTWVPRRGKAGAAALNLCIVGARSSRPGQLGRGASRPRTTRWTNARPALCHHPDPEWKATQPSSWVWRAIQSGKGRCLCGSASGLFWVGGRGRDRLFICGHRGCGSWKASPYSLSFAIRGQRGS